MAQKAKPFLWYEKGAEEAVRLYTSLIPDSKLGSVRDFGGGTTLIDFELAGVSYIAMESPGAQPPNESFSVAVTCSGQEEVDRIWEALVAGGKPVQCGWLRDKWGFCWQIVPAQFFELMSQGSPEQAQAVMTAMMGMVKMDVAALQAAFDQAAS